MAPLHVRHVNDDLLLRVSKVYYGAVLDVSA